MENPSIEPQNHEWLNVNQDTLFKNETIGDFLQQIDINKNPTLRLISWCIKLSIFPETFHDCFSEIINLHNSYQKLIQSVIPENADYYSVLAKSEKEIIQNDLVRSILWYKKLCQSMDFDIQDFDRVQYRAGRILSLMSLTDKELSYTQGYDRFVFITFLEAQISCLENHLSDDFAEAFSFYLSKSLISLAKCHIFLDDIKVADQFFRKYDEIAAKYTPNIQNEIVQAGQGAFFYALKWHIVLFADEFNFQEVLLIWDNIILNHEKFDEYMECLYISQMEQIEKKGDPKMNPAERIHRFKNDDINLFIRRANDLFTNETSNSSLVSYGLIATAVVFTIAATAFFVLKYRRHRH